jgi:poly(3-hydroxybutyrate) depolymerase
MRDLVIALLEHAESVAVADWLDPRFVPLGAGEFGFADNITSLVAMLRALGPDTHVVAVCQAGSPALAATALLAAEGPLAAPRSLTLVGCPIDPAANMTGLARVLQSRPLCWLRENLIEPAPPGFPGSHRRVYARERQFQYFLAYLQRHFARQDELFWKLMFDDGEASFRFPFWTLISSLMDLTEEFVLEDIQATYHDRALVCGALIVGNRRVEPRAIAATAVLTIEGGADDLAPPGQTRAALDLVAPANPGLRRHVQIEKCGHFSLFHGHICRRSVVPEIVSLAASAR